MTRRTLLAALAAPEFKLVIIGDDIGAVQAIGEGTILAYQNGIERSANWILPGPWALEAVELFRANPGLAVGVHLCLNSEWTGVKWRPLTPMPSLVDANGYLPATTRAVTAPTVKLSEIEAELRAQIEMAKKLLPRVAWVSAHMGAATGAPAIKELTLKLAAEYKTPLQDTMPATRFLRAPYNNTSTAEEKVAGMIQIIDSLTPGRYALVDHPATDTPELRRVKHPGNENVAEQRSGVLKAWTDARVIAAVQKRGIDLASVADILRPQA